MFLLESELSVFWLAKMSRTPSTLRMGLLLYAKGVTDRWQRKQGYKCKKRGGWYSCLYSVSYLTLMVGDKGIKCPSVSPKQCRKVPSGTPPLATTAVLSAPHATAHRWLHSLPPHAPGKAPRATRWWMCWSVGTEWPPAAASALPRLAAAVVLSGSEACRSPGLEMPWLVFPASSSCRGLVALPGRVARRGKFLGMPWLAFPASSSCWGLASLT